MTFQTPSPEAVRRSVLDLGSNSFHVLIADTQPDGGIVPIGREREMLHLGAVVQRHGHVPDGDRDRAVDVVRHLTELAARLGATERLAVATSALRDASNGPDVIAAMEAAAGTTIDVIDGREEARLAYLGVRASVGTDLAPLLVLDLGGGSLELAIGQDARVEWSTSLDLGVSRLSTMLDDDPPTAKQVKRLHKHVRRAVREVADEVAALAPRMTVAVGGTIRALARVLAEEHHTWMPATLNLLEVPADDLADLRDRLVAMDVDARAAVPGMKSKRADRIHIAAVVLTTALAELGIDRFVLSDWGLREGVLLDRLGGLTLPSTAELRAREVERMRLAFVPDDPHLRHVATLATSLFDGTRDLHGLDDDARELLEHGATLHDIGETLALRGHHRHGAYLLEHAEMRGFTPRETALLCSLVRFHRSRGTSRDFPPFAALDATDQRTVEQLVALLQLADGLDRARDQAVDGLAVDVRDDGVVVRLSGTGLHVARAEFDRKTALFERVFALPVTLDDAAAAR